jgi:anti-anti-sigma regulatory factor
MSGSWESGAVPVTTRIGRSVVVTLPRELSDEVLSSLRREVLERVQRWRAEALIFEASGLDIIDAAEFDALSSVARGARWLGVRPMLVGLSAGIVAYLVNAASDTSAFEAYGQLDDALEATRDPTVAPPQPTTTEPEPFW